MSTPPARVAALLTTLAAASCASPQPLAVDVNGCTAQTLSGTMRIVARIGNRSDRPISRLDLISTFYQNFRYQRFTAQARVVPELDPGSAREIVFAVDGAQPNAAHGGALRCIVTHIGYLDGTSADAPPAQ